MFRFLLYLFPALVDLIVSAIFFTCQVRIAEMGRPPSEVANLGTVWGLSYILSSLVLGRLVSSRHAGSFLVGACLLKAALATAFIFLESVGGMYALMPLFGLAGACFYVPFQTFMKQIDQNQDQPVANSAGVYTFAWSIGFAVGPLLSGAFLARGSWVAANLSCAVLALLTAAGLVAYQWRAARQPGKTPGQGLAAATGPHAPSLPDYSRCPDLAWMAWLCGGIGCVAWVMAKSAFPSSGKLFALSKFDQGLILFVMYAVQAFVGLWLARSHWWMYRPGPVLAFGLLGVLSLVGLGYASETAGFLVMGALFGVYSGSFYFYFVFHSLIHPERSTRYIAINEAVVGACGVGGPWLAGWLGDCQPETMRWPYLAAAGLVAGALLVQAWVHGVARRVEPQEAPGQGVDPEVEAPRQREQVSSNGETRPEGGTPQLSTGKGGSGYSKL